MPRIKRGITSRKRHKKILKMAKGYRGRSKNCFRVAVQRVEKALQYAYRDRKNRKRDFRRLWIQRINAAVRAHGITYSQFMHKLSKSGIDLNRKSISEIAIRQPDVFRDMLSKVCACD